MVGSPLLGMTLRVRVLLVAAVGFAVIAGCSSGGDRDDVSLRELVPSSGLLNEIEGSSEHVWEGPEWIDFRADEWRFVGFFAEDRGVYLRLERHPLGLWCSYPSTAVLRVVLR